MILALAALFFSPVIPYSHAVESSGAVELHAHLFMKEGMSWFFSGGFNEPLHAKTYLDGRSSQANPETLEKSGLSIVVATLYAHPLLTLSMRESVWRQILQAREFVKSHPDWIIATTPQIASDALQSHHRVMILALEGASGIIENEDDLNRFVDDGGIRIVTPLHLMDDRFGGVAFLRGFRALASPIAYLKQLFHPEIIDGVRTNRDGLTEEGQWLVQALLDHHVWIDLSHASDRSIEMMIPFLKNRHQPLLYTHTVLRQYNESERAISETQLKRVKESNGIVGLMPSEEFLEGAPYGQCPSGIAALAFEYEAVTHVIGNDSVMLGSDYNGAIPHLALTHKSSACITGTSIDEQGLWNISQSTEVWTAMASLGAPVPKPLSILAEHFIKVWRAAYSFPEERPAVVSNNKSAGS